VNKVKAIAVVSGVIILSLACYLVYAAITYQFHQTLTVPNMPSIAVYRQDGLTQITNGEEVSSLWSWTGTQFALTIVIKNTGNTIYTTSFTLTGGTLTGWVFTALGNGTLARGASQTVNLVFVPPNANGGTTTGDFVIVINAA
jgi:hypothetical protein